MGDRFGLSKDEFYRLAYNAEEGQVLSSVSNDDEIEIEPLEVDEDNAVIQSLEAERQEMFRRFTVPEDFIEPEVESDPRFQSFLTTLGATQRSFRKLVEGAQDDIRDNLSDMVMISILAGRGVSFYNLLFTHDQPTGVVLSIWMWKTPRALPTHGTSGRDRERTKMLNFADNYGTEGEL